MATQTTTYFANQPDTVQKSAHVGEQHLTVQWNSGAATASAGDVVFLAKIPHGARITDINEYHSTGATATSISLGLATGYVVGGSASLSLWMSAVALGTRNSMTLRDNNPPTISVSDGTPANLRYGILAAKLVETGTATTSLIINLNITYSMDRLD